MKITDLAENLFYSVLMLPLDGDISAEDVKKDFKEKIDEFSNEAANNGYSSYETENAKYAVCAWIDEYIYVNCSISAQWFSHSLVLSEFEDAEAGRHFFDRMDVLHKNANSAPLLELYAKCILFGFMGKFRIGEHAELKQILNFAISKTNMHLEPINYKPATKNKHKFSFRTGVKNILITGHCEEKCKAAVKKQVPPKGYKYIYSKIEDYENLPFIDGIILINPLRAESDEKQEDLLEKISAKAPIYKVADLEIQEIPQTLDKNYEFNTNHLNYYLHKYFLDEAACKNILSMPRKLELFKNGNAFYSMPFFPFMQKEKPVAYSLLKRVFLILFLASILFFIAFFAISIANKHKEEIKAEAVFLLSKHENDSIKLAEERLKFIEDSLKAIDDSLNLEFESKLKNLKFYYQKEIVEKFPFKEGKIPSAEEVSEFFGKEGEFQKFMDLIDTISDARIKFNKKALAELKMLKNSIWSDIPVSIIIKAPKTASVKFSIDSLHIDVEKGSSANLELKFPGKNGGEIELLAKTANNVFKESIKGEWSLLKIQDKHVFSFTDKSYLVDVELYVHWHLPKNSIKPHEWFALQAEPDLIETKLSSTLNTGE